MPTELSMLDLFLNASLLVKLVMFLLLALSVASWTMIFTRLNVINDAETASKKFETKFWSGIDLASLYQEIAARSKTSPGIEALFKAGFKEFAKMHTASNNSAQASLDASQRGMRVALSREIDNLESNLSLLATIGSISPYIGLFGTVWGIMNSFIALGAVQQATLAMVAPGIAEALIATAMGLFAAIPAVIGYNRFTYRIEKLENTYVNFMEEFSGVLHRQVASQNTQ